MPAVAQSLIEEFEALLAAKDPQRRGYGFESLIAKVFRQAHFDVDLNPAAARPRQTDLVARGPQSAYLVEVRWRGKPAGSPDVDDLYSRLRRAPPRVDGVLISVEGFTAEAIEQIESMRDQRIVVPVDGEELRRFFADPGELRLRLRQKHDSLLVHGTVSRELTSATACASDLPPADVSILDMDGRYATSVVGGGSYSGLTFWRRLPDIDWVAAGGYGVTCDLRVGAESQPQLLGVLEELVEIGWAGPRGQWTITQSEHVWHGFGLHSLALAVEEQATRIAGLDRVHHTEELCYLDECPGGFYSLSARPVVDHPRVWPVDISFQLEGIPFDIGPLQRLADRVAPGAQPYFRPRSTDSKSLNRFATRLPLDILATVIEKDEHDEPEEWVVGVIARNPFRGDPDRLAEFKLDPHNLGARLEEHELLVCDLHSWHLTDQPREYVLSGIDIAWTSDVAVLRPYVDWDWSKEWPQLRSSPDGVVAR